MEKPNLFGCGRSELQELVSELRQPRFRANQIFIWMYRDMVWNFEAMTNLPKDLRARLSESYRIELYRHDQVDESADGTKKYLYPAPGEKYIEAAYIPEEKRATLCLSTQVGCKMGCLFCMTARQGFQGQLSVGEILSQVYSLPERETLTNIVYMGMGEPMDNIDAVISSIKILSDPDGLNMSQKRITVSSIGIIPAMRRYLEETRAPLAISIHNPIEEERRQLMPVQSVYPIAEVVSALRDYDFSDRRLSFEYIMFQRSQRQSEACQCPGEAAQRPALQGQSHPLPPDSRFSSGGQHPAIDGSLSGPIESQGTDDHHSQKPR
jgi:23S rRNA (adenine2503-C2)-methyltransferase